MKHLAYATQNTIMSKQKCHISTKSINWQGVAGTQCAQKDKIYHIL